ncbi:uncharacterized protein LOC123269761 [Cotesia glomerata]|uniref:uncharacterized protein LOC123269761 n=1 Tax=Cotesia glomerata TaxID=32391 RepID=UPI001D034A06|nr:uncharacterized protein LOC123269761 [Cotesia glomerata]
MNLFQKNYCFLTTQNGFTYQMTDTRSPSEGERPVLVVPKFLRESFEMADRKASRSRPEKSKEAPGNAVSRFIQRLSPTKRYRGQENPGASSSSISQKTDSRSGKKDSSTTKNSSRKEYKHSEKLTKSSLNLLESSSSSKIRFLCFRCTAVIAKNDRFDRCLIYKFAFTQRYDTSVVLALVQENVFKIDNFSSLTVPVKEIIKMDSSQNNYGQKPESTSISQRYPILRAFLLAEPSEYEKIRNGSSASRYNNNNNSAFVSSTSMDSGKQKHEDDENTSQKK